MAKFFVSRRPCVFHHGLLRALTGDNAVLIDVTYTLDFGMCQAALSRRVKARSRCRLPNDTPDQDEPTANLLLAVAHLAGAQIGGLGPSTGRLDVPPSRLATRRAWGAAPRG